MDIDGGDIILALIICTVLVGIVSFGWVALGIIVSFAFVVVGVSFLRNL